MTLHLTCAFQVIKLPNERLIPFHYFFLQLLHIAEIGQTPQLQDPRPGVWFRGEGVVDGEGVAVKDA